MKELQVRNNQRDQRIDTRLLHRISRTLIDDSLAVGAYSLGIHLVSARRMAELNEQFLQHSGPTDVITFNLDDGGASLTGEIYVCVAVAMKQAGEFRTTWPAEVVRYVVHGVLHLLGYDDLTPSKRRLMKREENKLVRSLARCFDLNQLAL